MPYIHLTPQERYVISHLKSFKLSLREIARRLGRHHSSISREIRRNGPKYPGGVYWYYFINPVVEQRRHQAKNHRRQNHPPLVAYVEEKLLADWPPQTIAQRLRSDFPQDERMRVSHETIYRWVFLDAEQGGKLHQHLLRRHKRRRRQKRYGAGRRFIPGRVGIDQRPSIVAERHRFGDWEADLVLGRRNSGAIATHVERKSRYLMASLLADRKAESFNAAAIPVYQELPEDLRQTLTLDNGKEFSRFKELEADTGLKVYFADPYAAWQRWNDSRRRSTIDGRTTSHPSYALSQKVRKRIEEGFGWMKTVGRLRKTLYRGVDRIGWQLTLHAAAYNLVRMRTLGVAAP